MGKDKKEKKEKKSKKEKHKKHKRERSPSTDSSDLSDDHRASDKRHKSEKLVSMSLCIAGVKMGLRLPCMF